MWKRLGLNDESHAIQSAAQAIWQYEHNGSMTQCLHLEKLTYIHHPVATILNCQKAFEAFQKVSPGLWETYLHVSAEQLSLATRAELPIRSEAQRNAVCMCCVCLASDPQPGQKQIGKSHPFWCHVFASRLPVWWRTMVVINGFKFQVGHLSELSVNQLFKRCTQQVSEAKRRLKDRDFVSLWNKKTNILFDIQVWLCLSRGQSSSSKLFLWHQVYYGQMFY